MYSIPRTGQYVAIHEQMVVERDDYGLQVLSHSFGQSGFSTPVIAVDD